MKLNDSINELMIDVPLIFSDIIDHDLSGDYVIPKSRILNGFYVKPDTAGAYRAVTLAQYYENGGDSYRAQSGGPSEAEMNVVIHAAIAAGNTVDLLLAAYEICSTPLCFLEADVAAGTTVNICLP